MKNFTLKFILLIISLIAFNLNAQPLEGDSLENLLNQHKEEDTLKVNLLNENSNVWNSIDNLKALNYAEEALEIAEELDFDRGKAKSLILIGENYFYNSNFPQAMEYYNLSMTIYEELGNKSGISKCLNNIGLIQLQQGNYTEAESYYQRSLKIYDEIGNQQGISNTLNNIGVIYRHQGNYPEALKFYQKALKINEEFGDDLGIANCMSNIGIMYRKLENFPQALKNYQNAMEIYEGLGDKLGISSCLNNIGIIYTKQENYQIALEHYQKSLNIKEELGDKLGISRLINNMGNIHFYNEDYPQALGCYQRYLKMAKELGNKRGVCFSQINIGVVYLETKDYPKALGWTLKSLEIAQELNLLSVQKEIYAQLAEIYEDSKDYQKAYENHIIFKEFNDSIFNEANIQEITRLENQYEFDKEKNAIELEQQKKDAIHTEVEKREKFVRNALIIGVILLIVFVLVLMRSFAQKHKANRILSIQKSEIEEKNTKLITLNKEIQDYIKELEETNNKLNELNATKDKFFTVIAHDLKNPFNALLGFSDLLIKNQDKLSSEKREMYNKLINDSSKKIYNLLENLLAWAHSQSGLIEFSPEKINIKALIHEIIILSAEAVQNKNIVLFDTTKDKLFITADKNMLSTILRNLISNAIKFSKNGSEISINAHKSKDLNNNEFIEIAVKDQGLGISPERQSTLFKIAENSSTPGTDNETGTGLGLILCKEFVEKHGGEIWVESEVDVGSKFIFTLRTNIKD